jgi:acetyl esterase/lipase
MARRFTMIALLVAVAFAPAALAQRPSGDAATFAAVLGNDYRAVSNITYLTASGVDLKLDVYSPRAAGPVPTVLFFHGGGYRLASKKENSVLSLLPYIQMGWTAINVEYRPTNVALAPAAVEDARCAVRWAVQNAKEYNVDVNKIIVTGQSAGGHLALMAGLAPASAGFDRNCPAAEPLKVAAVVNWYGITDYTPLVDDMSRTYAVTWIGNQPNYKQVAAQVSPVTYASRAGLPPVISIHGDADPTVPYEQAPKLIDALKKAGGQAELVTIPGGRHGGFERDQMLRAFSAIEAFLTKNGVVKAASTQTASAR